MNQAKQVAKAFKLTDMTRQIMREGIRRQHRDACESEIHELSLDRLLRYHGTSLAEVRQKQREQAAARSSEGDVNESRSWRDCGSQEELNAYKEYAMRVRYKLIPGVW